MLHDVPSRGCLPGVALQNSKSRVRNSPSYSYHHDITVHQHLRTRTYAALFAVRELLILLGKLQHGPRSSGTNATSCLRCACHSHSWCRLRSSPEAGYDRCAEVLVNVSPSGIDLRASIKGGMGPTVA
jgi:hypothetical protein